MAAKVKPAPRLALGRQIKAHFSDGKWHSFGRRMLRRLARPVMRRLPLRQGQAGHHAHHLAHQGGKDHGN